MLQMLYDKWWKEYGGAGQCDTADDKVRKDANALTIANVGGVFVVLVVGLVLSPMVAVFEFVWNARRRRRRRAHDHSAAADRQAVQSANSLSVTVYLGRVTVGGGAKRATKFVFTALNAKQKQSETNFCNGSRHSKQLSLFEVLSVL